ncbi:hypothetical protein GCM10012275_33740 [Longimycelium tulufanense]|uniref:Polysaccharide biosynthesis protein n=1 Tax=Longimycelium tulufanense TaxID=907463 RepID=A0A8J3FUL8_9PSEU|nr:oligosaccharide flippase family protein [Longimycelium tulufanense]GGM59884.1 hypothetical protein GCM10012275_33740 [Longimycelium tulufanense]
MAHVLTLGSRFRRGLSLSLLNTMLTRSGSVLLGMVLARLLAPEEFGVYAVALLTLNLLLTFNDFGVAVAVVRHEGDVRPMLPTVWTMSIIGGALVFLACLLAAPFIASALGAPQATGVVRLIATNVLLDGFAGVPGAMLARRLAQDRRLVSDLSGIVLGLVLTAVLAFHGWGPWALAVGNVAGTALTVVLLIALSGEYPRLGFDRTQYLGVARYGSTVVMSSLMLIGLQTVPQAVAGRLLGATTLGLFYLANTVANWPVSMMRSTMERITVATFAQARDGSANLGEVAGRVLGIVASVVLPGAAGLVMLSDRIVWFAYGPSWMAAAPVLGLIAVAAAVGLLTELMLALLIAMGKVMSAVLPQIAWLLALVPCTIVGAEWGGVAGVGWAQLAAVLLVAVPVHLWALGRAGVQLLTMMKAVVAPVLVAVVLAIVLFGIRTLLPEAMPSILVGGLLTGVVVGCAWIRAGRRAGAALDEVTVGVDHAGEEGEQDASWFERTALPGAEVAAVPGSPRVADSAGTANCP